jgi:HTH-type transcriptional regulator/antitoxin HigA
MDEKGLKRQDLFPAKSRASECMRRKRPLTIAMIRKLHFEHGIPAEILIAPYRVSAEGEE